MIAPPGLTPRQLTWLRALLLAVALGGPIGVASFLVAATARAVRARDGAQAAPTRGPLDGGSVARGAGCLEACRASCGDALTP